MFFVVNLLFRKFDIIIMIFNNHIQCLRLCGQHTEASRAAVRKDGCWYDAYRQVGRCRGTSGRRRTRLLFYSGINPDDFVVFIFSGPIFYSTTCHCCARGVSMVGWLLCRQWCLFGSSGKRKDVEEPQGLLLLIGARAIHRLPVVVPSWHVPLENVE